MIRHAVGYLLVGAFAGFVSGLIGVGGGLVLVPALAAVIRVEQHIAHGTSLATVLPIALSGAVVYSARSDVDWPLVGVILVGSIIGVVGGARLMMRLSARRLRQVFALYSLAVGALMLLRSFSIV